MKHKVGRLEGALLDAAVAKAEGEQFVVTRKWCGTVKRKSEGKARLTRDDLHQVFFDEDRCCRTYKSFVDGETKAGFWLHYTGSWELGGPILEREHIDTWHSMLGTGSAVVWHAEAPGLVPMMEGPTPLIAGMRAYVASKFGEEVEL